MTNVKTLTKALNTIATFIYEPIQAKDEVTGELIEKNALAFVQKRILNGVAYSAALTLQQSQKMYDEAVAKVRLAARSHRGDEISETQLQRAIDWAQRLELQVATLDAFLEEAKAVYAQATGESFAEPKQRTLVDRKFQSPALEAAARFGINTETNMGGGIEVAEAA